MSDRQQTDPRVAALRAFGRDADADNLERMLALDGRADDATPAKTRGAVREASESANR